jgi:hypothetical protein
LVRTEIINSQKRDCFLQKSSRLWHDSLLTFSKRDDLLFISASILRTVANGEAASISKCRTKLASNCLIYQLKIVKGILDRVAAMEHFRTELQGDRETVVLC